MISLVGASSAMEANPQKGLSTPCSHTSGPGSPHHRSKGEERLQNFGLGGGEARKSLFTL
jgi:hypothetical protein